MAVRAFPITGVQTWMGHADIARTRKYVHYAPYPGAAKRLGALVDEQLGGAHLQGKPDAGGGTRTPDTRIMIPLL